MLSVIVILLGGWWILALGWASAALFILFFMPTLIVWRYQLSFFRAVAVGLLNVFLILIHAWVALVVLSAVLLILLLKK